MADEAVTTPIVTALQSGDSAAAQRLCERHLERQPEDLDALLLLGVSLQRQHRFGEAVPIFAKLARLNPKDSVHWGNYATALKLAGDLGAAEEAAAAAVRLAPDDADRLEQLGLLQIQHGNPYTARDTLLRAFGQAPQSPSIRIHAAFACAACSDYRVEELLRPWRGWLPLDDALHYELADALLQSGDANAALELLEDLLRRMPSHLPARLLLANVYERVNRIGDAATLLQQVIASAAVADPAVHADIAQQQAQLAMREKDPTTARKLLEQSGAPNETDYVHYFVLAKACDAVGDYAAAMRALRTAHTRQINVYKIAAPPLFEPDAVVLPRAKPRVSEDDYRSWPKLIAPGVKDSPVFIIGFPRSGTTLLEQMLDAHPKLQSMDERPFFNILANQLDDIGVEIPRDLGRLNQRDCDELRKGYLTLACSKVPRRWNAQLVDKNPLNMLWLPMIHRLFPQAKFILALRHPCDVILSCYMQNFRAAVLAVASQSLEQLARTYVAAMESWLYHVDLIKPDVFVSRYEDLVSDTPQQTRLIAAFLGLDDAESLLQFDQRAREKGYIATPSYTQVIEPINRKGLNRWLRYREYFEPVLPILRPMLDHWGYVMVEPEQRARGGNGCQ